MPLLDDLFGSGAAIAGGVPRLTDEDLLRLLQGQQVPDTRNLVQPSTPAMLAASAPAVREVSLPPGFNTPMRPEPTAAPALQPPSMPAPQMTQRRSAASVPASEPSSLSKLAAILQGGGDRGQGVIARIGGMLGAASDFDRSVEAQNMTVRALVNRGMDPETAGIVARDPNLLRSILPNLVGPGKPTDEIREYQFDIQQRRARGETDLPTFGQWKAQLRKAGATNVSVTQPQETAFSRERGKQQAQRLQSILTAGELAHTNIANLDAIEAGLNAFNKGSFFGTGAFAPYELEFRRFAQSLGIGNADALAGAELANAVRNRMALLMRNPDSGMGMPGALSDADRNYLTESQPGIERTPEGNKLLIEVMRRMERRKIEIAELANRYVAENGNLDGFDSVVRRYADENPLFADLIQQQRGQKSGRVGTRRRRYNPATGAIE